MLSRAPLASLFALALLPGCPFGGGGAAQRDASPADIREQAGVDVAKPLPPGEVKTHPRLFVREVDLPRLRAWATDDNPMFAQGLKPIVEELAQHMDAGEVMTADDLGNSDGFVQYPPEGLAMIFAFYSMVGPQDQRASYAARAKKLLMAVINIAAKGPAEERFRMPKFSVGDRSRWFGMSFPLTVDWIYGSLSADEKKTIRSVFLRWCEENQHADITGEYNHPVPIGMVNDPKLLADWRRNRWATNNYWTAHGRNLTLMALSFDAADDPDEKLRKYLGPAMGAWLYMTDALLRGDSRGGLEPAGFEYLPLALAYVAQTLLALYTAGRADPAQFGKHVVFDGQPFWDDVIPGYLHSLSPIAKDPEDKDMEFMGKIRHVAWYGDGEKYFAMDFMGLFGAMGVYDHISQKNLKRLSTIRWIETHYAPGGEEKLYQRAADVNDILGAIFYFLLFDPKVPKPADPRSLYPLTFYADGINRFLQRTSWKDDATWFSYKNSWNGVDHQSADGGMFELWRKGEWLTKERTGYGDDVGCSDYKNTVVIQNAKPYHGDEDGYRKVEWKRGSQWTYVGSGDPKMLAKRWGPDFSYFHADMTNLYNSKEENSEEVAHVSRSLVYLVPDRIVTYDRLASKKDNKRFKRFWMSLPERGTVKGELMSMRTSGGQNLYVRTLLPEKAGISVEKAEPLEEGGKQPAANDPIHYRLRVDATGHPKTTRFLHVIQGADKKAAPDDAALIDSSSGQRYQGASFHDTVVMFPVDIGELTKTTYDAPAATKAHLVTGLTPNGGYTVTQRKSGSTVTTTVSAGGAQKADTGGVLTIGKL